MKRELPLHDAGFDGIVTGAKTTTLYFTRSDGVGCAVHLNEVSALEMRDFREGNICLLFELATGETPPSSFNWDRLFPAPHPWASAEHHREHIDFVKSKLTAIEVGNLTLVEMQPAYGADLLAVCHSVDLADHGNVR